MKEPETYTFALLVNGKPIFTTESNELNETIKIFNHSCVTRLNEKFVIQQLKSDDLENIKQFNKI